MSDVECQSWFRSSGFHSVVSPGSQKSCGCVILFRPSLLLVNFSSDDAGRFVSCEFCFQDKSFRVVSLYAPNRNPARDQFFEQASFWVDPSVLPSCVVTSIRFLTAHSIVLGRTLPIPRERVPPRLHICLMCVVLSIPGVIFIPHLMVLPG